ncbi:fibrinogen-like protein 1-like protein [Latimeria chalumnae]|uniref:fibrinogen-like protein 1-like protein n=1 Tax=Latimeria chalumnae TaxID=7897 RepID=UPI0003C10D9E|nr:PREDICTED: fibrinogen-like protein 1-like protein [Latimeria chalumnae]|eukprot:XP_005986954.1 PREDICTED: fibrinogen-like protein 1-like protein [Latimeria chalumnae]
MGSKPMLACLSFISMAFLVFGDLGLPSEIQNTILFNGTVNEILNFRNQNLRNGGYPRDCDDIPKNKPSGVYVVQPSGGNLMVVFCDMNTEGKGWTVIQRNNIFTQLDWARIWNEYKSGFGDVQSEHWLGNKYIYQLTQQRTYKVRFIVQDSANIIKFAEYDYFKLGSEAESYALRVGTYSGTVGDQLTQSSKSGGPHDNRKFSTRDRYDSSTGSCANSQNGGWWYNNCYDVLLNRQGQALTRCGQLPVPEAVLGALQLLLEASTILNREYSFV